MRISDWSSDVCSSDLRGNGYAVVAFDQPAQGRSDGRRSTLPEFARTLAVVGRHFGPAAALIGHSLGGADAAVAIARDRRSVVEGERVSVRVDIVGGARVEKKKDSLSESD